VQTANHVKTIVICSQEAEQERENTLGEHQVECLRVHAAGNLLDMHEALLELGAKGIGMVMCEGGPFMASTLLSAELVDELRVHIAPRTLGSGHRLSLRDAERHFELHDVIRSGDDILLTYRPQSREE